MLFQWQCTLAMIKRWRIKWQKVSRTTAKHFDMGAIPNAKGVIFREWAHHAEIVYLIGPFKDWNETSTVVIFSHDL